MGVVQMLLFRTGKQDMNSNIPFFPLITAEAANLPPLTEAQKNKLRHLSVVTLAAKIKVVGLFFLRSPTAIISC